VRVRLVHAGDGLTLDVRDDGRGLAGSASPGTDGTAHVGLAGMRERVAALGGDVVVAGAEGGGAAVTVRLPLARPSA